MNHDYDNSVTSLPVNTVFSLSSNTVNPAILAVEKSVSVLQGSTAELEVHVSGYPIPTNSQITWYYPNDNVVLDTDTGVEFQDGGRKLKLSNVQPQQAGLYDCEVVLSHMNAITTIELNIHSKYTLIQCMHCNNIFLISG